MFCSGCPLLPPTAHEECITNYTAWSTSHFARCGGDHSRLRSDLNEPQIGECVGDIREEFVPFLLVPATEESCIVGKGDTRAEQLGRERLGCRDLPLCRCLASEQQRAVRDGLRIECFVRICLCNHCRDDAIGLEERQEHSRAHGWIEGVHHRLEIAAVDEVDTVGAGEEEFLDDRVLEAGTTFEEEVELEDRPPSKCPGQQFFHPVCSTAHHPRDCCFHNRSVDEEVDDRVPVVRGRQVLVALDDIDNLGETLDTRHHLAQCKLVKCRAHGVGIEFGSWGCSGWQVTPTHVVSERLECNGRLFHRQTFRWVTEQRKRHEADGRDRSDVVDAVGNLERQFGDDVAPAFGLQARAHR